MQTSGAQVQVGDVIAVRFFEGGRKGFVRTNEPFREVLVLPGVEVKLLIAMREIEQGRHGTFTLTCGCLMGDADNSLSLRFPGDGSVPLYAILSDARFKVSKVPLE